MNILKKTTAVSLCSLGLVPLSTISAEKPNVLLILVDDMGCGDAGFNGCKDIHEDNDLSMQFPEVRQRLQVQHDAWMATMPEEKQ